MIYAALVNVFAVISPFWWFSVGIRIIWAQRSEFKEIGTSPDARSWPGALWQCFLILWCAPYIATEQYLKENGV